MDVLTQLSDQDVVGTVIEAGLYETPESMIVGYRYRVLWVQFMDFENEIFVIVDHPLLAEIRVIKILQKSHEPLRRMLSDEDLLYIKNSGYNCDGEVMLIAIGDRYSILM
jgi:hypothetical protein